MPLSVNSDTYCHLVVEESHLCFILLKEPCNHVDVTVIAEAHQLKGCLVYNKIGLAPFS